MALLGLLSLLQIWFIPGYLFLYRTPHISRLDKLLLAVPLSATINFFLVYALVLLHAYTQQAVIAIFAAEVVTLSFFVWQCSKRIDSTQQHYQPRVGININFTNTIFAVFVLIYAAQVFNQFGTVFVQGDAVSSWNPWAISWFKGTIPTGIAWYPQLLPTLYSLTYQFMAESRIELFAKLTASIYPLVVFAIVARMAVLLPNERKKILWAGIIFFLLVRRLWGGDSTVNGYADFPLAFFCISILYVFVLKLTERSRNAAPDSITLAVVLVGVAIGAGLMKQSGVFLGMLIPFVWLAYCRNGKNFSAHLQESVLIGVVIALISATWYMYQYWRIANGMDQSNLQMLSSIVQLPWYASIAFGFKSITYKLSWLWVLLFMASLAHAKVRYLALFVALPFFLLWAAFVPYDYRNLAAVFPVLAITLAYGWAELVRLTGKALPSEINWQKIRRGAVFASLAMLAVALANPKFNGELIKLSDNAKNQIGDPEINNLLMAYFEFHPETSRIATSYQEMSKIPSLKERYAPFSCVYDYGKQSVAMQSILSELKDPAIHHILLQPWCDSRVLEYFASHPEKFHTVFQRNGAVFYEIKL